MKLIKRPFYLENLINVKDIPDIKIITGIRRSRKSVQLFNFTLSPDHGFSPFIQRQTVLLSLFTADLFCFGQYIMD